MATFVWTLQLTTGTQTIGDTDIVGFYGSSFDTAIATGEYQDSTHAENSSNTELCTTNHGHNTKYVSSTNMSLDGGASEAITNIADAECPLDIDFSHTSAVTCTNITFWAYDGTTMTAVPTNITFYAAESGDSTWTNAEGSAAALSITDSPSSTDHNFYILVSASPGVVGDLEDFELAIQLTYQ
jgi:hypothetical protein